MENWKIIAEAPDYAISDKGRVKRIVPDWQGKYLGRILKPSIQRGGYHLYLLRVGGKNLYRKAHRLVCEAWNGPPPSPMSHAAHWDGDTGNNTPRNLRWATALENAVDKERHGRVFRGPFPNKPNVLRGADHWAVRNPEKLARGDQHYARSKPHLVPKGENRHNSKLTKEQVREIRETPHFHGSGTMLANKFGVSRGLISSVRYGRVWRHSK